MTVSGQAANGAAGAGAKPVIGVVGLGTMGGAMARHLVDGGYQVVGHDVVERASAALREVGGTTVDSPAAVVAAADMVILSLPTLAAFDAVVEGSTGLAGGTDRRARIVIEASTLPLEKKEHARDYLAPHGLTLLDCPISGTGAQMAVKDIVYYASGDSAAVAEVTPVLAQCSRAVFDLGEFGNGTKLKLVANHLVTVHNASAAEALVLAQRGGIDPAAALEALKAGAGTSRMLEVRGPMMVEHSYEPATMRVQTFMKDISIITEYARHMGCSLPVFAAAAELHVAALGNGWADADTACVHSIVERLAGS